MTQQTTIYRTKNYIAFDGDESYFSYLNMLKWSDSSNHELSINNAHEINDANDESKVESIKKQLKQRLDRSKNVVLIIDKEIKNNRKGIVEYEINYALRNGLPIILAFKNYSSEDYMDCSKSDKELLPLLPNYLLNAPKAKVHALVCPMTLSVINRALEYSCRNLPQTGYTLYWR